MCVVYCHCLYYFCLRLPDGCAQTWSLYVLLPYFAHCEDPATFDFLGAYDSVKINSQNFRDHFNLSVCTQYVVLLVITVVVVAKKQWCVRCIAQEKTPMHPRKHLRATTGRPARIGLVIFSGALSLLDSWRGPL